MFGSGGDASASLLGDQPEDSVDDVASASSDGGLWKRLRRQRESQQREEEEKKQSDSPAVSAYHPPPSRPTSSSVLSSPLPPVYVPSHSAESKSPSTRASPAADPLAGISRGEPLIAADPLDTMEWRPAYLPTSNPRVNRAVNGLVTLLVAGWSQLRYFMQHSRVEMKKRKFKLLPGLHVVLRRRHGGRRVLHAHRARACGVPAAGGEPGGPVRRPSRRVHGSARHHPQLQPPRHQPRAARWPAVPLPAPAVVQLAGLRRRLRDLSAFDGVQP